MWEQHNSYKSQYFNLKQQEVTKRPKEQFFKEMLQSVTCCQYVWLPLESM